MNKPTGAPRPRVWTPTFCNLIFISLASTSIVDALQAALPIYIDSLGRGATLSGLLVTIFAGASIPLFLASGPLVDRFGRRVIMFCGAVLFFIGVAMPLLLTSIRALLLARVIQGCGFAVVNVASAAAASYILPRERLGEGIGYYGLGQSLALALGPTIGLGLINHSHGDPRMMWLTLSGILLLVSIASFFCFCDRPNLANITPQKEHACVKRVQSGHKARDFFLLFFEPGATWASLLIFLTVIGVSATIVFSGLYAQTRGFSSATAFFVFTALAMIGSRFGSGLFMDRYSPLVILVPTLGALMIAFLMLAYAQTPLVFSLAGIPFGLGFGVVTPLLSSVAVKRSPHNRGGVANSMFYLSLNMSFGVGALIGGRVISVFGFRTAFLLATITAILPLVIGYFVLSEKSTNQSVAPSVEA